MSKDNIFDKIFKKFIFNSVEKEEEKIESNQLTISEKNNCFQTNYNIIEIESEKTSFSNLKISKKLLFLLQSNKYNYLEQLEGVVLEHLFDPKYCNYKIANELIELLLFHNIQFQKKIVKGKILKEGELSANTIFNLYRCGYFYKDCLEKFDLKDISNEKINSIVAVNEIIDYSLKYNKFFIQRDDNKTLLKNYLLSDATLSVFYKLHFYYKEDLYNVNLETFLTFSNVGPKIMNEIVDFFDEEEIPYIQKEQNNIKLCSYDNVDYNLQSFLYKNNFYFIKDILNLRIEDLKFLKEQSVKVIDNFLDFLFSINHANFTSYKNRSRICNEYIRPHIKSAMYKAGIYFLDEKKGREDLLKYNPSLPEKVLMEIEYTLDSFDKIQQEQANTKKRIPWDKYQVSLLIDTYLRIQNNEISHEDGCSYLSKLLRTHATKKNIVIDEYYRNKNGISMCLEHIRYLYSEGNSGLKNVSTMEKNMVEMQQKNQVLFNQILDEAKQIYLEEEYNQNKIDFEQLFLNDNFPTIKEQKEYKNNLEHLYNNISLSTPIDNLNLSTKTSNSLILARIETVQQLINIDIHKFREQKNVGPTTIAEVETIINELKLILKNSNHNNDDIPQTERKSEYVITSQKENLVLVLEDKFFIKIENLFDDEWILQYCKKLKIKNLGILAHSFPDKFAMCDEIILQDIYFEEKEPLIRQKLFEYGFSQTPIYLTQEQIEILSKNTIDDCLRLNYENILRTEIQLLLFDENYRSLKTLNLNIKNNKALTDKDCFIIKSRYGLNCKKLGLEEIGQLWGVTRERVRQLQVKAETRLLLYLEDLLVSFDDDFTLIFNDLSQIFFINESFDEEYENIIKTIIKLNSVSTYYFDYNYNVVLQKDISLEKLSEEIVNVFHSNNNCFVTKNKILEMIIERIGIYNKLLNKNCNDYFEKLVEHICLKTIKNYFIYIEDDLYKLKLSKGTRSNADNNELIGYYFEQLYKTPVKIPQDNDVLFRENLKDLFEKCPFLNEYETLRTVERLIKEHKDIVFYGLGEYIHINNVNVDFSIFNKMIQELIRLFSLGKENISPLEFYNNHIYEFKEANINNEYELIGLIAYTNHKNIAWDIRRMLLFPRGVLPQIKHISQVENLEKTLIDKITETLSIFKSGFRINSKTISITRFRNSYSKLFDEECELDDEKLLECIKEIGLLYNDFVYTKENLVSKELEFQIKKYIDKVFETCNILYFENIMNVFKNDFIDLIANDTQFLKTYLEKLYNKDFYITSEFIAKNVNVEPSPTNEIKQYLKKERTTKSKEEIYSAFSNYSQTVIDKALFTDREIVSNKQGAEYFYFLIFEIDNTQINVISNIINKAIKEENYITGTELFNIIEKNHKDILTHNSFISRIGLRKCLALLLDDIYTFNGDIISSGNMSINSNQIFETFLEENDIFTYDSISEYALNMGRQIPWTIIFKTHIRINENDFIRKNDELFNIEEIDRAIERSYSERYFTIEKFDIYELLPLAKYTWNNYLLESYIYSYSKVYKLLNSCFAKSVTTAIIIKKDDIINDIDELLINEISLLKTEDEDEILKYLRENGFITRIKSNIKELIIKARELKNRRMLEM